MFQSIKRKIIIIIIFSVKTTSDVHVFFAPDAKGGRGYEFVIGGWDNEWSVIRKAKHGSTLSPRIRVPKMLYQ